MGIKEIAQRKEAGTRMGFIIDSEKTGGILAGHGQDIKSSLLVLLERFRLYTFIAFHPKRPTDESRGEYYKLKRQRNG